MVKCASMQPESLGLITPSLVNGPLQKPFAQSLANKLAYQTKLHQLDFVRLATIEFCKTRGHSIDM